MSLKNISGVQKRFFFLDVRHQTLYIYKNDQSLAPLMTLRNDRIRSVHYAVEKYSRFFQVIIGLHSRDQIRLLFETIEERDEWGKGLSEILDHANSFSRRHSTIQLVERLCEAASRKLGVRIRIPHEQFLESVPDSVLQYVPEVVEEVLRSIREVVDQNALSRLPIAYRIKLVVTRHGKDTLGVLESVQYDPSTRCMVISGYLSIEEQDGVVRAKKIIVPPFSSLEAIVQSKVYRDPIIERWLNPSENDEASFQRLYALLHRLMPASSGRKLSFQWDQKSDELEAKEVQSYVKEFVTPQYYQFIVDELEAGMRSLVDGVLSPLQECGAAFACSLVDLQPYITNPERLFLQTQENGAKEGGQDEVKENISGIFIDITYTAVKQSLSPRVGIAKTNAYYESCRPAFLLYAIFSAVVKRRGASQAQRSFKPSSTGSTHLHYTGTTADGSPPSFWHSPLFSADHCCTATQLHSVLIPGGGVSSDKSGEGGFHLSPSLRSVAESAPITSSRNGGGGDQGSPHFLHVTQNSAEKMMLLQQQSSSGSWHNDDASGIPLCQQVLRIGTTVLLTRYLESYREVLQKECYPFEVMINWGNLVQAYAGLVTHGRPPELSFEHLGSAEGARSHHDTGRTSSTQSVSTRPLMVSATHNMITLTSTSLLLLVQTLVERYRQRLRKTIQTLQQELFHVPGSEKSGKPLLSVMERYVRWIAVDFTVLSTSKEVSRRRATGFSALAPSVRQGVLRDMLLCRHHECEMMLNHSTEQSRTTTESVFMSYGEMDIVPAAADLHEWCQTFFAKGITQGLLEEVNDKTVLPESDAMDELLRLTNSKGHLQRGIAGGDRGGGRMGSRGPRGPSRGKRLKRQVEDSDPDSEEEEDRIGDHVAAVRRSEVERIPLYQVRTKVYDAQGDDVRLKIGLEDITTAVNSLRTAIPGLSMFLHDAMLILMRNLSRLRKLFYKKLYNSNWLLAQHKGEVSSVTSAALPLKKAVALLKEFCEYRETSDRVEGVCRLYARLRRPERLVAFCADIPLSVLLWRLHVMEQKAEQRNRFTGDKAEEREGPQAIALSSSGVMLGLPPPAHSPHGSVCGSADVASLTPHSNTPPPPSPLAAQAALPGYGLMPKRPLPTTPLSDSSFLWHSSHPPVADSVGDGDGSGARPKAKAREPIEDTKTDCTCCSPGGPSARPDREKCKGSSITKEKDSFYTPFVSSLAPQGSAAGAAALMLSGDTTLDHVMSSSSPNASAMMDEEAREWWDQQEQFRRKIFAECFEKHSSSRVVKDGKIFDFSIVADIALNLLLPRELAIARQARRVGLLFGLEQTGKTLISNSLRGIAVETVPTVGMKEHIAAFNQWILILQELGGRECFRKNWKYYVQRVTAIEFLIFTVDAQNRLRFEESRSYLMGVIQRFPDCPLLVILNNYPQTELLVRAEKPSDVIERRLKIHKLRKKNPKRWIRVVTCDVTLVHSSNSTVPPSLEAALLELSMFWVSNMPKGHCPPLPKEVVE